MQYKDLLFKITSSGNNKLTQVVNPVKQKLQSKDILIGVMIDTERKISEQMLAVMKSEIERTLTVLLHSPIAETFAFLPLTKEALTLMVDNFPNKRIHYISTEEEYSEIKELKSKKLNIHSIYKSETKLREFTDKIKYLVTINTVMDKVLEATLKQNEIMVFPIDLVGINTPQITKEKIVKPDGTGWVYNSANGMWVKSWGDDGMAEIRGW